MRTARRALAERAMRAAAAGILACAACSGGKGGSTASPDGGAADAEAAEAGADGDAALACTPGDISGFTPSWKPRSGAHQGACTAQQLSDLYTACLAPAATKQSCAPFGVNGDPASKACAACVLTKATNATLGPVVISPSSVEINFAGCLALVDPSGVACAQAYQADVQCTHAACDGRCPQVVDATTAQLYATCLESADMNACTTYAKGARCAFDAADGGDAAKCLFAGTAFADLYAAVAPLFCGP